MFTAKKIVLICLVLSTTFGIAQTGDSVEAAHNRLQSRLELARGYLIAAGLQAPAKFAVDHLPELRAELTAWLEQQSTSPAPLSPGAAPAATAPLDESTDRNN